jgi:hypothetical protein
MHEVRSDNETRFDPLLRATDSVSVVGLDVGGVLLRSPWELLSAAWPDVKRTAPSLLGPFSQGRDSLYAAVTRGALSETEYWSRFSVSATRIVPMLKESANPVRDLILASPSPIRMSLIEWIRGFVASNRYVITFSNGLYRNLGKNWWVANIPQRLIHKHYDASETHIRKPDVRVFAPLTDFCRNFEKSTVVYVDDNPHYVSAAKSVGVRGLWFCAANEGRSLRRLTSLFKT